MALIDQKPADLRPRDGGINDGLDEDTDAETASDDLNEFDPEFSDTASDD